MTYQAHTLFTALFRQIERDCLATARAVQAAEDVRQEAEAKAEDEAAKPQEPEGQPMTGAAWREVWDSLQADDDRAGIN